MKKECQCRLDNFTEYGVKRQIDCTDKGGRMPRSVSERRARFLDKWKREVESDSRCCLSESRSA